MSNCELPLFVVEQPSNIALVVMASSSSSLQRELHASFFLKHLRALPPPYASQDVNRVVLVRAELSITPGRPTHRRGCSHAHSSIIHSFQAYFCVHGLAVLGELERIDKRRIIEWVYSLQVHPDKTDRCACAITLCA